MANNLRGKEIKQKYNFPYPADPATGPESLFD